MPLFRRRRRPKPADAEGGPDADRIAWAARGRALMDEASNGDSRWKGSRDPAGLQQAADAWRQVADLLPEPSPERAGALNEAGLRLMQLYEATELEVSLAAAREVLSAAVSQSGPDRKGIYLTHLGATWRTTYERSEDPADLDQAIRNTEAALTALPRGTEGRPAALANLAAALRSSYRLTGQTEVLDRAVQLDEESLATLSPDSANRAAVLNSLANGLSLRLAWRHDRADADRLVRCREEAMSLVPAGSTGHIRYVENLAIAYSERAEITGDLHDMNRSVELSESALLPAASGSAARRFSLRNLASHLQMRYLLTGSAADVDRAVDLQEEALHLSHRGGPEWLALANDLAGSLRQRFVRAGSFDDLERAIALLEEAVDLTPSTSPEATTRYGNLGNALRARYLSKGSRTDLSSAITAYETAAQRRLPGSPPDPTLLNNLGSALNDRYDLEASPADGDRAMACYEEAFQHSRPGSVGHWTARNNQGRILVGRAEREDSLPRAREAVAAFTEAVAETVAGTPDLIINLLNLGSAQLLQGKLDSDEREVREALATYRRVVDESMTMAPQQGLLAARAWGRAAEDRGWWSEAAEAYRNGLRCLDALYGRQGRRDQKESWLQAAAGLAAQAAYALVRTGDPAGAVVVAETGRAVILAETFGTVEADLTALRREGHPELADRYDDAADALEQAEARISRTVAADRVMLSGQTLPGLRATLAELAVRIRELPGHGDFRQPPTRLDVVEAAGDFPLVYLVAATAGGLALLVSADGTITPVDLPQLSQAEVGRRVVQYMQAYDGRYRDEDAWRRTLADVTGWLWPAVMAPVVQALAALDDGSPDRACLLPMGWLGLLPLHAAWRPDPQAPTGRRHALDDVLLTYAPNARSITHARATPGIDGDDGILAVGEPMPVRASRLSHAAAEAAGARAAFASGAELFGAQAHREAVLRQMTRWPILHFAGHATADQDDPLRSGLLLADDEQITLADLMATEAFRPKLVVLSACETAVIGGDLPDEVVNLPSGFLQAGARGVIGSFWSVYDESTALVMGHFYEDWRSQGSAFDPARGLRDAQQWLRDAPTVTAAGASAGRKVSTSDLSPGSAASSAPDMVHWAPFCYVGL